MGTGIQPKMLYPDAGSETLLVSSSYFEDSL
jgi:hypothetical protein